MSTAKFQAINSKLLFSKKDPLDLRIGDKVFLSSAFSELKSSEQVLISGSCDDEGIFLNGGRPGAAFAPDVVREFLYKMTWPFKTDSVSPSVVDKNTSDKRVIQDFGNFKNEQLDLQQRHQQVRSWSKLATDTKSNWIHIGGGHDYGFPSAAGFLDSCLKANNSTRPIVINFDAHLDVRAIDKGLNSGTPFFRLLTEFRDKIDFYEVGIQPQCNSSYHLQWAQDHGAKIYFYNQLNDFLKDLETKKSQPIFFSMDIDVFSSAEAPGCSQSWPLGLSSQDFFSTYFKILKNFDVKVLGLYEFSPRWDESSKTAKLSALILYYFIFGSTLR